MERESRHIPNYLQEFRVKRGFSQQRISEILGFSCRTIVSHWEQGNVFPIGDDLLRLSILYGCQPYELYPDLMEELQAQLSSWTAHF